MFFDFIHSLDVAVGLEKYSQDLAKTSENNEVKEKTMTVDEVVAGFPEFNTGVMVNIGG